MPLAPRVHTETINQALGTQAQQGLHKWLFSAAKWIDRSSLSSPSHAHASMCSLVACVVERKVKGVSVRVWARAVLQPRIMHMGVGLYMPSVVR